MASYRSGAAMAALSFGVPAGFSGRVGDTHMPNPNAKYTDSGKPMSKRRKRRLKAKSRHDSA